jgi:hypothetical protein
MKYLHARHSPLCSILSDAFKMREFDFRQSSRLKEIFNPWAHSLYDGATDIANYLLAIYK